MKIAWESTGRRLAAAVDPGSRLRALGLGADRPRPRRPAPGHLASTTGASANRTSRKGRTRLRRWPAMRCRCSTRRASSVPHVFGASLGGMIAQELAVAAPERVDKLVLGCTTPGGPDAVPMPEVTLRLFAEAPSLAPEVALRRFVENALGNDPPAELVDELFARRMREPARPGGLAGPGGCGHGVPGRRGGDHRADADRRRHSRQRRRLPQRGPARRPDPGLARRAARRLPGICSSGSSRTSPSGSSNRFLG